MSETTQTIDNSDGTSYVPTGEYRQPLAGEHYLRNDNKYGKENGKRMLVYTAGAYSTSGPRIIMRQVVAPTPEVAGGCEQGEFISDLLDLLQQHDLI